MDIIEIPDGDHCDVCPFLETYTKDGIMYGKCRYFKIDLYYWDWWLKDKQCSDQLSGKTFILKEVEND